MKVELELPDPPAGWEYTGEYRAPGVGEKFISDTSHVMDWYTGALRHRAILRKIEPPYPAPEGYEFTGEFRPPTIGDWFAYEDRGCFASSEAVMNFRSSMWILRKKKPTYTEAVKATGWKWPRCLDPNLKFITHDRDSVRYHYGPPSFDGDIWLEDSLGDGEYEDIDVDFTDPPELVGHLWSEMLLCRDDFI